MSAPSITQAEALAELRTWVGREVVYEAADTVERGAMRYFAIAVGDPYATSPSESDPPPTFVCESNQWLPMPNTLPESAYIGHEWSVPLSGWTYRRAGNIYEFLSTPHLSDRLTVRWRLNAVEESEVSEHEIDVVSLITYSNQRGEVIATNKESLAYMAVAT